MIYRIKQTIVVNQVTYKIKQPGNILMLKRFMSWLRGSTKQEDEAQDDNHVEKVQSLNSILGNDEQILWEGAPSPRHSWSDHDQLAPPSSIGMNPGSLIGRVLKMFIVAALILILGIGGVFIFGTGLIAFSSERESVSAAILSMSLGLALISILLFLLQPLANYLHARQLRYVITTYRALVLRLGPVRYNLWMKLPLFINLAIFFIMFALWAIGAVLSRVHNIAAAEDGVGLWLLFVAFLLLIFISISLFLAALGGVFSFGSWLIISDAAKDKSMTFVRSFYHRDTQANNYPSIRRLRKDGTGDIILDIDCWEDSAFSESHGDISTFCNEVGFLSVSDAEQVAEHLHSVIYKQ